MDIPVSFKLYDSEKPLSAILSLPDGNGPFPLIIFSHGFKGFMNWGHFPAVASWFAGQNIAFLRYNFSLNGTTLNNTDDFDDLEAFASNTFSRELNDLTGIVNSLSSNSLFQKIDFNNVFLCGHSRGGAISILAAAQLKNVCGVITWAAISDIETRLSGPGFEEWKEKGRTYVENSRTNQLMPLNFTLYTDYIQNKSTLEIKQAAISIDVPALIVHGTQDETVHPDEALNLVKWIKSSHLVLVDGADHAFGATHPFLSHSFNNFILQKLHATRNFITQN